MFNMLFKNPKIMQMLRVISNSDNPMAQMDAMLGDDPQYRAFKQKFNDKSEQEIIHFFSNALKEQGINLNGLINTALQFGLIK